MPEELSIDNKMLAYLFDPDDGLKQDVEDDLAQIHSQLEMLDNMQKTLLERHSGKDAWRENFQQRERAIEITQAEITFYEDVWGKIRRAVTPLTILVGASDRPQAIDLTLSGEIDNTYEIGIDWGTEG